ncbi:MAG: hypothetical protein NZ805_02995 [Armatimonadetes bacterium]|nr:hypothetical protein [Armatimonadota bacterium]MDW8027852.1 hypothetical protein [Armatimonadota bacterium]
MTFKSRDLVDFLLQGLTDVSNAVVTDFVEFICQLKQIGKIDRYTETDIGRVYGQVFRQYTYACLDEPSPSNPMPIGLTTTELFPSSFDQFLYELATCTDTSDPNYVPHPKGRLMEKGHIGLWENWEGMALHDNVVFLGKRPSKFILNVLAHNVENDYFHLYLLTLYQKVSLSMMACELLRQAKYLHLNLKEAREIWDSFMMFRNHYWFAEVSFKPQGNEIYRRYQSGLEILPLYQVISDEVKELREHYERKFEQKSYLLTIG